MRTEAMVHYQTREDMVVRLVDERFDTLIRLTPDQEQALLALLQRRAWVPVGERLPEAHRVVLCCHQEAPAVQWFGSHSPDGWYTPTGRATDPTHWQPLPAGLGEGA